MGKQIEQTFTVDDNCLPSAQELEAYKQIDPQIVQYLIDASVNEQKHRHQIEDAKLKMIAKSDKMASHINSLGMFYAFLCVVVIFSVAALALYLDKPWFAGIFSLTGLVSVVSAFTNTQNKKTKE